MADCSILKLPLFNRILFMSVGKCYRSFFFVSKFCFSELSAVYKWQYAFSYLHKSLCLKSPLMFTSFDGKTC